MNSAPGDGPRRGVARRVVRASLIGALGFFALVAQTLLFRVFLIAFEGNELGVGCFFGSWLVWVALGALVGRMRTPFVYTFARRFEWAVLLYLPAFVLQHILLSHARVIAGVTSYEAFPYLRMMGVSFGVNAPISFLTGLLFTAACRWWTASSSEEEPGNTGRTPSIAWAYLLETLGAFVGGLLVTALIASGVGAETAAFGSALLLAVVASAALLVDSHRVASRARYLVLLPAVALALAFPCRVDLRWEEYNNRATWTRLLPVESYRGAFTTSQGVYLYGEREGQFVVTAWGGTADTLPNLEHGAETAALHLAQHPSTRSALVIGPDSLALCARLKTLPQMERVVWLHPDPEHPSRLLSVLPEALRSSVETIEIPEVDVREYVQASTRRYDLIVLNIPDAATLMLNRYSTREFFESLKSVLAEDGVVSLRVSGGENFLGGELAYLGASALATVESLFGHIALKPGDESWLMASDGATLTQSPAALRERFAAIPSAATLFPPDGLPSLYPPDRVEFQMTKYREAIQAAPHGVLVNTDTHPKALVYSLLVALRRAGVKALSAALSVALAGGMAIVASAIGLYGLLRFVYRMRSARPRNGANDQRSVFDGAFLVFSMGLVGMALSVTLMFLYQARYGSLFLHIGLISSLFMLGSFGGGAFSQRVIERMKREPGVLLPLCIIGHVILVLAVLVVPHDASRNLYAILFALCGAFTGAHFPIAAARMRLAGRTAGAAGSTLDTLDHLGGAAGAVVTGLLLLPLLGSQSTLVLLALLVAVNATPLLSRTRQAQGQEADWFDRTVRPAGYTLFGVAAFLVVASQTASVVQASQSSEVFYDAARAMARERVLTEETGTLSDGRDMAYFTVGEEQEEKNGYVFNTAALADDVYGYAGPLEMAVLVNDDGTLVDFRILGSKETPAYLRLMEPWRQTLKGRNIFASDTFKGMDAVSGATLSSDAVMVTLQKAAARFAAEVLGRTPAAGLATTESSTPLVSRDFVCLALLMTGGILLRYRPNPWLRRGFLLAVFLSAGMWLNLQYSSEQMASLMTLSLPRLHLSGPFFLVVVVPVAVVLFGNVYCGYVCPFGALQELVGELRPASRATDPGKRVWRYGRAVKYALLFLVVVLFALTRDSRTLTADPLITLFGTARTTTIAILGVTILALSLVFRRFWCRNLCPAGAFLALLNGLRVLRRLTPATRPAACDLGVRSGDELDCIVCDRCRHAK